MPFMGFTGFTLRRFSARTRARRAVTRALDRLNWVKSAGILDPLVYAPISAIAGGLAGPSGERGRSSALAALIGAGVSNRAQDDYEERKARGEPVPETDYAPLLKAILAGTATGGVMRARAEQQRTGRVGVLSSVLAGGPAGALLMEKSPVLGSILGSVATPTVARLLGGCEGGEQTNAAPMLLPEMRARVALLNAVARIQLAREITRAKIDAELLRRIRAERSIDLPPSATRPEGEAVRLSPERNVG